MQKAIINIGDKIELTHVKSAYRRKLSDRTYGSKLLDYDGFREAKVSMPIYEGKIVPLELDDEYDLCFFTSFGLFRCRAKVKKRFREGRMHVLLMEFLSLPKKYQRRKFFRLECMMEIRYREISQDEKVLYDLVEADEIEDFEKQLYEKKMRELASRWNRALLTDISGGGVRFQCKDKVDPGTYIEVDIPLQTAATGAFKFRCMAKVVAIVDIKNGAYHSELRCEFDNIGREQRESVVKYVFEEQKRRLRKE